MNGTGKDFDLVVFDLDGTLVDSIPDIAASVNGVLESAGFPILEEAEFKAIVGWGLARTLELALPESLDGSEFHRLLADVMEAYSSVPTANTTVYPDLLPVLSGIREAGVPMAVFTNKAEEIAGSVVERLFPAHTFEVLLGGRHDRPAKPDPAALQEWMVDAMPRASAILFVGDSPVDGRTARACGAYFAAAGWGYRLQAELESVGFDRYFRRPADLGRWIFEKEDHDDEQ